MGSGDAGDPMARLTHFCLQVPVGLDVVLPAFMGDTDTWLGGRRLDRHLSVLALEPAGFPVGNGDPVAVEVVPGLAIRTDEGALRRLSFGVPEVVPQTRCDLTVIGTPGEGVRYRLRGEFRPSVDSTAAQRELAAVEAVVQPLVLGIVERTAGVTLHW